MECNNRNPEKEQQTEKFFEIPIKMTLEKKLSWHTLSSLLEEMISDLSESKQLIRILLKELETSQSKLENDLGKGKEVQIQETTTDFNKKFDMSYANAYNEGEFPEISMAESSFVNESDILIQEESEEIQTTGCSTSISQILIS